MESASFGSLRSGVQFPPPRTKEYNTYIRLIDKDNFVSTPLHIQHDEDEFLAEIEKWKQSLLEWVKEDPLRDGMPLGRLDAGTCMIDLIRYLADYYSKTTPNCGGRVWATLKLEDFPKKKELRGTSIEDTENIVEIKTYE